MRIKYLRWILALSLTSSLFSPLCDAQIAYPVVRKVPFDTLIYGVTLSDEYFWMSRKENVDEVMEYSREQTKFSRSMIDSLRAEEVLSKELDEAYSAMDDEFWNLKPVGSQFYYSRYIPGEGALDLPQEKQYGRGRKTFRSCRDQRQGVFCSQKSIRV